jgi:hypothetical protein
MTSLFPLPSRPLLATALSLTFLISFAGQANAQRYLSDKAGSSYFKQEVEEDPDPEPPTNTDVGFSSIDLTTSSNYTKSSDSESSHLQSPKIQAGKSYTKRGRTRTKDGYIAFESDRDDHRSCAWYTAQAVPLQYKTIRMYYTLKFDKDEYSGENGEGTTVAFIPSTTTVTSSTCGGQGKYLGFGTNGAQALPAGHFGVEFDTQPSSSGMTDPSYNHFAILSGEVSHSGSNPTCPASSAANTTSSPYAGCWTGYRSATTSDHHTRYYAWLETEKTNKFRLEITACQATDGSNVCAAQGCTTSQTYVKGWICEYGDSSCSTNAGLSNVNQAYSGSATATIGYCLSYDPATYPSLYLGFTYGTSDHSSDAKYYSMALVTRSNK